MTVLGTRTRQNFAIIGGTTYDLAPDFLFLDPTDIYCIESFDSRPPRELVYGTDFTVTGGDGGSGTVITSEILTGETLTVYRDVEAIQQYDARVGDGFNTDTFERQLDRMVMAIQETETMAGDGLRLPITTPDDVSRVIPEPSPLKYIRWDPTGTFFENTSGTEVKSDVESVTLSDGQLDVVFTNDVAVSSFLLNGPNCDNGRLLEGVDYTLNEHGITLAQSYPAGSIITMTYTNFETDNGEEDQTTYLPYYEGLSFLRDANRVGEAYLSDGGRSGIFVWSSDDHYDDVLEDSQSGIFVAPNSDLTGASGAWIRTFSGQFNIEWFGAIGNGIYDCTDAIQATIDMAVYLGGGKIYLPTGSYNVYGTIKIDRTGEVGVPGSNNVRLQITGDGEGNTAIIQKTGSVDTFLIIGDETPSGTAHGYFTLERFAITGGSSSHRSENGIRLKSIAYINLNELTFHNLNDGLVLDGCLSSTFNGITFNESNYGITALQGTWSASHANIFIGCEFRMLDKGAFNAYTSLSQNNFIGCNFETCGTHGDLSTAAVILRTNGREGIVCASFEGCYFEDNGGESDIYMQESGASRSIIFNVSNCNFNRVNDSNFTEHNIATSGKVTLNISGCSFTGHNSYTPDPSRKYILLSTESKMTSVSCIFDSLDEAPMAFQSTVYPGVVYGHEGDLVTGLLPNGWSVSKYDDGVFQVIHNFGHKEYAVTAVSIAEVNNTVQRVVLDDNAFYVGVVAGDGTFINDNFSFMCVNLR